MPYLVSHTTDKNKNVLDKYTERTEVPNREEARMALVLELFSQATPDYADEVLAEWDKNHGLAFTRFCALDEESCRHDNPYEYSLYLYEE